MNRHTSLRQRRPAKPGVRAAEQCARILVYARACQTFGYALCEVCGRHPPTNYQHRKNRAHCTATELWAPSNGLAVCGHGNVSGDHGLIHQNPAKAYANGWSVRSSMDPAACPVWRRGELVWLFDDGSFVPLDLTEITEWVSAA
jgi:hypothetical protein